MMRRIVLEEGQTFDESQLSRLGVIDPDAVTAAAAIVAEVRKRGDEALREYTERFDHVQVDGFRVPDDEVEAAYAGIPDDVREALEAAAASIRHFHEGQKPRSTFEAAPSGAILGSRVTPLDSAGIYVPGGRAQYPSTVLMNAIPASVAGVGHIIMCAPPTASGSIDPVTLAAAHIGGVHEIYRVGGAQAIAAMAYGTESIPRVDKVTGPGNSFVAAAKKIVMGDVGIDMIAGPSEVCVMADNYAQPELVAIDLMAQAEHDPAASCYLVTVDEGLADEAEELIAEYLKDSPRADITRTSLEQRGLIVVCPSLASAIQTVNTIAPEHLEIHMTDPMELLGSIRNAGAIFLGEFSPESAGDYVAGPNHTLPTGGTARFSSPLSTETFMKRSSVIQYTYSALEADADTIQTIAMREGLWSHARAVSLRMELVDELYEELAAGDDDEDDCGCGGHHHHAHDCGCEDDDCTCDDEGDVVR